MVTPSHEGSPSHDARGGHSWPYRDPTYGGGPSPRGVPPYGGGAGSPYAGRRRAEAGEGAEPQGPHRPEQSQADAGRSREGADEPARDERAADSPPPEQPEWDPYAPGPLWRRPLTLGIALLALIGALFLGLFYAAQNEKPPPRVALPSPTLLAPTAPAGKYGYAGSRTTDKAPLTVRELFGRKKFSAGGRSYVLTVWRKEKKCTDAISGTKLEKALKAGKCTQLIRASFAGAKGTIIGTVGVANLSTSSAAKKVASAGAGGERTDFLKPLPGKDEATKNLGNGEAYAGGWTHGHYAVLLWFQFKDGHRPSKSELKRLYQSAVDITDKTVFPALEHRSLTGTRG